MTTTPQVFADARLTVSDGVIAPADVIAPLHAYALGHATGSPDHFRRAFRPTAHIEGIRDGAFASWDLETYCALFDGPAPDEDQRTRIIDSVQVNGTVAAAAMTLQHGDNTFTDLFLLVREADGWRIANKVYHRADG
jgi:3-hydroxyisobutyrate dehydrogenase